MGIVSYLYIKNFVGRFDKETGVPYYVASDFEGLKEEKNSFINSNKIEISYFYYYFDNYKQDKIVLLCPGIGCGHCSYMREIVTLAQKGYKVLTLDYQGCGESKGKVMGSLAQPSKDVNELLDYLKLDKEIVLVGHSLGAYTSLNVIHMREEISKAVIISGFLSIPLLANKLLDSKFIIKGILKYEKKVNPVCFNLDNIEYLKTTSDKLLFIHSLDDGVVSFENSTKLVEELNNPNIKIIKTNNRKHNPNYSDSAVAYMNEVFGTYNALIKEKKIKTDEDRINYFKDVSIERLTEQDPEIFKEIFSFIN